MSEDLKSQPPRSFYIIGAAALVWNLIGVMQYVLQVTMNDAAIAALLDTLDPALLTLPRILLEQIPARPPGHNLSRESFARTTGVLFDPMAPAASATSLTLDVLLNRNRSARMNAFHAIDASLPSFADLLDSLLDMSWYTNRRAGLQG